MSDNNNIQRRLANVLQELQEIVDDSIKIRKQSKEVKVQNAKVWEKFLSGFFSFIKIREKETGENLMWGISLLKIMK
ncbi:hypothetical protein SAMN00017405_0668 [Desulfonispora thiosulfatigenes DSM 11270]|uniref:Uncharacterized protein n=1 Tax=Desulfonispora thiosulfatigenes DSM 11270 TaxID=656914 RepID=A0A1W1V9B0_DESTI|nr:hypothetical protein [Desulfonispora thiosulfatigenes]SMB89853.1 hypothetical protein SAMN00017405_0668 [Desulfonispora thiosulfatigenes DSM 11270]